ncbi:MAG: hypothetical protein ACTFAL_10540 [Candidatus Electronema sp. V4]|uniref:hypothetical protein n=1 Tax=Candidatus Electronema sp. V4 TaxID=3454756 RepID=UPI0040556152
MFESEESFMRSLDEGPYDLTQRYDASKPVESVYAGNMATSEQLDDLSECIIDAADCGMFEPSEGFNPFQIG